MYASTIAHGANPWFGVNRDIERSPASRTIYRFNRLVHQQRTALTNGESPAEAALLESPLTRSLAGAIQVASGDDVHKRESAAQLLTVPRHGDEFEGLYAALNRSGYPFDVVEEDHLLERTLPARIRLLVLAGVGARNNALAERLREFVAGGGRLLATFDTGLFDEQGARRDDFALADVFGASARGKLNGPSDLDYLGVKNRSATGSIVVHLINWTSGERPSWDAIPLGPLRLKVRLPLGTAIPRAVALAVSGGKTEMTVVNRTVTFTIHRLEAYQMAILR